MRRRQVLGIATAATVAESMGALALELGERDRTKRPFISGEQVAKMTEAEAAANGFYAVREVPEDLLVWGGYIYLTEQLLDGGKVLRCPLGATSWETVLDRWPHQASEWRLRETKDGFVAWCLRLENDGTYTAGIAVLG